MDNRILDADICIKCETVMETSDGSGLRGFVCEDCAKKMRAKFDHWNAHGLYITEKRSEGE